MYPQSTIRKLLGEDGGGEEPLLSFLNLKETEVVVAAGAAIRAGGLSVSEFIKRYGEAPEVAEQRLVESARERAEKSAAEKGGEEKNPNPFDLATDMRELLVLRKKSPEHLRLVDMVKREFGKDARVVQ